ncbi:MAG: SDR family oxidoreductase [Anaerolineae bacterium]|nr:SDR family oxidoreductase [Anaerolineae bacterium]
MTGNSTKRPRGFPTPARSFVLKYREGVLARIPIGRVGSITDVAGAVIYLASPAGALVTGTILMVDGGWTAQ